MLSLWFLISTLENINFFIEREIYLVDQDGQEDKANIRV